MKEKLQSRSRSDPDVPFFLQNLESLATQNTTGVVFYPRLYHLMAYICVLMGDGQNCSLFLDMALSLCEAQGNVLEKCWLEMSKVRPAARACRAQLLAPRPRGAFPSSQPP